MDPAEKGKAIESEMRDSAERVWASDFSPLELAESGMSEDEFEDDPPAVLRQPVLFCEFQPEGCQIRQKNGDKRIDPFSCPHFVDLLGQNPPNK